jgi:hypothetical protein
MYAVSEIELRSMSSHNTFAALAFAVGSYLLGLISTILVSYLGAEKLTAVQAFLLYRGTWFLGVFTVVFYAYGIYAIMRRNTDMDTIKKETIQKGGQRS